jgi:hypothetical protein
VPLHQTGVVAVQLPKGREMEMKTTMMNHCVLASTVVGALAFGGFAVITPAMAQVGSYYDYAPGDVAGPGLPWGSIIANSNHSVPFDPADAALAYRYGKNYGFCGFTIAGC